MKSISALIILISVLFLSACVKDKTKVPFNDGDYPANIANILVSKCATSGCHNTASKDGAAGIDFSTWSKMMEGGRAGATVIPFFHKQSTTFLFTNTYDDLGAKVIPTMPYNGTPLSHEEIITLRDWIDAGAPDKNGFVKFSDNPQRHKIYITNQACQLVAVVDAESKLVMRYIQVGTAGQAGSTHRVMVSADGSFWCVCAIGGTVIQKFSTADDKLISETFIGTGSWNTFALSHDGTKAFVVDFNGNVAAVDLANSIQTCAATGFAYPHGSALSIDEKFLYITGNKGNVIYKIDTSTFCTDYTEISVDGNAPLAQHSGTSPDIHDILFSPDHSKYFITCENTNEVRVMNAANDSLLAIIPVGVFPQEMAFSTSTPYLFVTCMEDVSTFPGNRGSVYVIDYNTLSVVKSLNTGWQPHGVAVDDVNKLVYVANRNYASGGPAPHHSTDCAGRNGYLKLIDLNTLQLVSNFNTELSVDPYSAAYR